MVYDPVRDCDIPSPAITRRPSLWDNPTPPQPPAFTDNPPQSGSRPLSSSHSGSGGGGGSLRNILNDDGGGASRRGSDMTVMSSHSYDDDPSNNNNSNTTRPHLAKLLNTNDTTPLVRTNSASSSSHGGGMDAGSPHLSSPSISLHPASAGAQGRPSRSPLLPNQALSSPSASMGYPYDVHTTPGYGGGGPSSRRSSMDNSRPMPPPADPVRQHDLYSTPVARTAPLRSPSVSVSPRLQNMHLPNPPTSSRHGSVGRPTSSRSASGSNSAFPLAIISSPERRLSDDMVVESPISIRTPYDPVQPSNSYTIRRPITDDELARLRAAAANNNPLRRKMRRSAPGWSAPSPKTSVHDYDDAGPSRRSGPSSPARRGSTASAATHGGDRDRDRDHRRPTPSRNDSAGKRHPAQDYDQDHAKRQRPDNYHGVAAEVASHCTYRLAVSL